MNDRGGRVPANMGASVRQRLFSLAKAQGDDFQRILTQYALERLLYRISRSEYDEHFIRGTPSPPHAGGVEQWSCVPRGLATRWAVG